MSRISAVRSSTLQLKTLFEIAALGGRKFVVEDDRIHVRVVRRRLANSSALPLPMNVLAFGRVQFLNAFADDFAPGGGGQFGEFLQGIPGFPAVS